MDNEKIFVIILFALMIISYLIGNYINKSKNK